MVGGYIQRRPDRPLMAPVVCAACDWAGIPGEGGWIGPCRCGLFWSLEVTERPRKGGAATVRWLTKPKECA